MTGKERREQLILVGRKLFAEKGFEGTSVEEIASRGEVSKPVVYEHFGGKEGLYAVVVDREIRRCSTGSTRRSTRRGHPACCSSAPRWRCSTTSSPTRRLPDPGPRLARRPVDRYVRERDRRGREPGGAPSGLEFKQRGLDPKSAPIHAQMLVGMVALTGQWWLEQRKFKKGEVAAHLVNMAWNGLSGLDRTPRLVSSARR